MPSAIRCYLTLLLVTAATALQADPMEEMVVTGVHDSRVITVDNTLVIAPDAAQLLKQAPGANVNGNGPLTGIPQYRGMFGARVATSVDGTQIAPSGPNWMDPPLAYVAPDQLESLEVYRGIAPVSVAQESIGGAVAARSDRGSYGSGEEFEFSGRISASAQSVNDAGQVGAVLSGGSRHHRFRVAATTESGDDAEFAEGEISPTEYQRDRYSLGYGYRAGGHSFQLDYSRNDTAETGTPALPMDIELIDGDLYSFGYRFEVHPDLEVQARLYGSDLKHGMTNYHLRQAPAASLQRRNMAGADNLGFSLVTNWKDQQGSWEFGFDGFDSTHNSDIDNPDNPMFFVENFNHAQRRVVGAFIERQHTFDSSWSAEFGLRYNQVDMDAGEVDGTPAQMMPPAAALRDAFNAADREQTDRNLDLVAKGWYRMDEHTRLYAGLAQKHRSPSYQERYLWLPLQATAGLADGKLYTGNIALDPEVSRQLEFGLDLDVADFTLAPRIFYSDVKDYIQGTPDGVPAAQMMVQMMNMINGSSNAPPLHYNNVDAILYGFDMDWAWRFSPNWTLSGVVNYVRGKRDDSRDDLYRIAPPNTRARLEYSAASWSLSAETVLYAEQDRVSETNAEQETAGYGVVNLGATWQATSHLRVAAGVDNLLDKHYLDHLGGYNRAAGTDVQVGARLPGYGTNLYGRLVYQF